MKKTLLTLFLAMAVAAGASAAQQTEVDKGDRFDYKYPVFTQKNPQAAQRMNRDIQKMVSKSRKDLRQPDMRAVGSNYEVIYENDQFVCLTFNTCTIMTRLLMVCTIHTALFMTRLPASVFPTPASLKSWTPSS